MDSIRAAVTVCFALALVGIATLLYSRSSLSSQLGDLDQKTRSLRQQLEAKDTTLARIRSQLTETEQQRLGDQAAHRQRERELNNKVVALQKTVNQLRQDLEGYRLLLENKQEAPEVEVTTPGDVLSFASVAGRFEATALGLVAEGSGSATAREIDCRMVGNAYKFVLMRPSMVTRDGQTVITGDLATKYRSRLQREDALSRAERAELEWCEEDLARLDADYAALRKKLDSYPWKRGSDSDDAARANIKSQMAALKRETRSLEKRKGEILARGRTRLRRCRHHITIFVPYETSLEDAPRKIVAAVTKTEYAVPEVLPELCIEATYLSEW